MLTRVGATLAAILSIVGCYERPDVRCQVPCEADGDCPFGFVCGEQDRCVDQRGEVCDVDVLAPSRLSAAADHACAVVGDDLFCWGRNDDGRFGVPAETAVAVPRLIPPPPDALWVSVDAGPHHTCAIALDGRTRRRMFCWGANDRGQAVPTDLLPVIESPTEVEIVGVERWRRVAAGAEHTCAIGETTDHDIAYCWGDNTVGQLARDTTTEAGPGPVEVQATEPYRSIDAGAHHTCILGGNGVECWGANDLHQTAQPNSTDPPSPITVPTLVTGTTTAVEVVAATDHTCARTADGDVLCWGDNLRGQLGTGTTGAFQQSPAFVPSPGRSFRGLATGTNSSCGFTDEDLRCWGLSFACPLDDPGCRTDRARGGLGLGNLGAVQLTPDLPVIGSDGNPLAEITRVAVGNSFACAETADGTVSCWGRDTQGQIGNARTSQTSVPAVVPPGDGTGTWISVVAGLDHTCGIWKAGTEEEIYCWGRNTHGEVNPDDPRDHIAVPSQVVLEGDATVDASFTLALGATFSCAVDRGTGGVQCWGDGATRPPDAPGLFTAGGQQAPLITAARYFACAVGQGATQVSCAGVPFEGGDTLSWDKLGPNLPVGASGGFQQLSNGDRFGCLLTTGGQAACWGMNDHGQLGDGTTATPMFPTTGGLVANGASVTVLSTGPGSHRCLGFTSGIACWGVNDEGQVDPMLPPTDQPTPVNLLTLPGGAQARSMGTGGHHTCAVYDAGAPLMTCWGRSAEGQLTNTPPDANGLVDVPAIGMGWKNVVTGDLHTCALDMNGQLACWGDSEWGQLGIGASDVAVATPIASLASP